MSFYLIQLLSFLLFFKFILTLTHQNVYGKELQVCSLDPMTGFERTGKCETNEQDYGKKKNLP